MGSVKAVSIWLCDLLTSIRAYVVDAKLHKDDEVLINNRLSSLRPATHASAASALVGVLATRKELVIVILDGIDIAVRELSPLVVEALCV